MKLNKYQQRRASQQDPVYLQSIIDKLKSSQHERHMMVTHIVVAQTIKTLEDRIRELKAAKKS